MSYYQRNKEKIKTAAKARQKANYKSTKTIITLGGIPFRTKKAMKAHFQNMLHSHDVGDKLEGDELAQFKDLADRHPRRRDNPPTIVGVHIAKDYFNSTNFVLDLADGTENCISYIKCVDAKPMDKYIRDRVQRCARLAIAQQIYDFRDRSPLICEVTGEKLERDNSHVDHNFNVRTFQKILDWWLVENAWYYKDVEIVVCDVTDLDILAPRFLESWQAFHLKWAKLRMVSKEVNLKG